jgi:hypothetical protein
MGRAQCIHLLVVGMLVEALKSVKYGLWLLAAKLDLPVGVHVDGLGQVYSGSLILHVLVDWGLTQPAKCKRRMTLRMNMLLLSVFTWI